MNQEDTSIYPDERKSSIFLIWSLVITGLCLAFIVYLRLLAGDYHTINAFWHLLLDQDYWGAWLTLGLLLIAAAARNTSLVLTVVDFFAQRPGITAAATFVFFSTGALLVYHNHPLSMDEYSARFQSEIFAGGQLAGKHPVALIDWLVPRPFQNYFLVVSRETGEVISAYLPGFALLLTPFTFLGIPWACNPAISALSLLALHKVAQDTLSSKEAGGWAILFALASPVFTINAMSYYSMSAHLLLNLIFTLLLLHPAPGKAFVAGLVGGLALVLHNPLPHALYALPWLAWLIYRRDFHIVGALLLGYLPLAIGLGLGWTMLSMDLRAGIITEPSGLETAVGSHALQAWMDRISAVVQLPNVEILLWRLIGAMKTWLWTVPGLVLLAWLGFRSRRRDTIIRLLFASAAITFFGYFLFPFDQGHGWGYRYFHSAWGVLPVLAAAALIRPSGSAFPPERLVAITGFLALASLFLSTALRIYQVEAFIDRHLHQIQHVDTANPTITFVNIQGGYYIIDLVQNHPRLHDNKRVIMISHGAEPNKKLAQQFDPSARLIASGPWGETWEMSPAFRIAAQTNDVNAPR